MAGKTLLITRGKDSGSAVTTEPIDHLIQHVKQDDPRLYEALKRIGDFLMNINDNPLGYLYAKGSTLLTLSVVMTPVPGLVLDLPEAGRWIIRVSAQIGLTQPANQVNANLNVGGVDLINPTITCILATAFIGDSTLGVYFNEWDLIIGAPTTVLLRSNKGIAAGVAQIGGPNSMISATQFSRTEV